MKKQKNFDGLCWMFAVFGALCLGVSIPATYKMVSVVHTSIEAIALIGVLELMAFCVLLAPLWVPSWQEKFNKIAYPLLAATTIGNFAAGWNYVWARTDLEPFWQGIRNWTVFGIPVLTIALVGGLSAAVPFGMKFFLGLCIDRYRENELDHSPEAVAARLMEPLRVQMLAAQMAQQQLDALSAAFAPKVKITEVGVRQALTPPTPLQFEERGDWWLGDTEQLPVEEDRPQPTQTPRERAVVRQTSQPQKNLSAEQPLKSSYNSPEGRRATKTTPEYIHTGVDVSGPQNPSEEVNLQTLSNWDLQRLHRQQPNNPAIEKEWERRVANPSPQQQRFNDGVNGFVARLEDAGIVKSRSVWNCSRCDAEGSAAQKGVAAKWAAARNRSDLLCTECRRKE